MVTTVSSKGQVVIPAKVRKKLHLREGSKLAVTEANGQIVLQPLSLDPVEESFGCLAGEGSLVEELLRLRREELEREDGRF